MNSAVHPLPPHKLPDRQLALLEAALAAADRRGHGREPVLVTQEELRFLLDAAKKVATRELDAR